MTSEGIAVLIICSICHEKKGAQSSSTISQALAAFEARLETDELLAYKTEMENLINAPQEELVNFVNQVFDPFCATLKKEGVYSQLEDEARFAEKFTVVCPEVEVQNELYTPIVLWAIFIHQKHGL